MPADYRIDPQKHRVWSSATGILTLADLAGHMSRLSKDPQFHPTYSQLVDFRAITRFEATTEQIIGLTEVRVFAPESRRAFVAKSGVNFGLARMFESYRTAKGDRAIRVFLDFQEAVDWLDAETASDETKAGAAPSA
jgi:hypothetical protein